MYCVLPNTSTRVQYEQGTSKDLMRNKKYGTIVNCGLYGTVRINALERSRHRGCFIHGNCPIKFRPAGPGKNNSLIDINPSGGTLPSKEGQLPNWSLRLSVEAG